MAETETPSPPSQAGKGIGGALTRKLGPLPVWGWALVGGLAAVFVYRYFAAKSASSAAATTPATTPTASGSDLGAGTSSTPGSNGYQDSGQLTQLQTQLAALQQQVNGGTGGGAGPGVATPTTPGFQPLLTIGDVMAAAKAGETIFEQGPNGQFVPTSYNTSTLGGFAKFPGSALVSETGAVPLFAGTNASLSSGSVSGAGGSVSPGVGTAGPPAPVSMGPTAPAVRGGTIGPLPASGPLV